jgi:alkanesulfonate monooxygenase SsuD/methylene tetrahydromethanopterin reductase-like flavin-dependent oxidoreductase (luciferase family)
VEYAPPENPAILAERISALAQNHGQRVELGLAAHRRAKELFRAERKLDDFIRAAMTS